MAELKYKKLFAGLIEVCYSQFYIESEDPDDYDSCEEQFRGQNNGLCGAATPERLFFTARPKDSVIDLEVHLYPTAPELNTEYTDVVEVSFRPGDEPSFYVNGHMKKHMRLIYQMMIIVFVTQ
ncbi:MAG: hypothetical protein ACRBEE_02040 [Arenicella sp.]